MPWPPPGDLSDPGIEPVSLGSSVLAGGFFTTSTTWKGGVWFTAMYRMKTQGLEVGKSRFMALQLGSRGAFIALCA